MQEDAYFPILSHSMLIDKDFYQQVKMMSHWDFTFILLIRLSSDMF